MSTRLCKGCGSVLEKDYPNRLYCTPKCKNQSYSARWPKADKRAMCTGTAGALNELLAAADLMRKGFAVFRALSPACHCDLVVVGKARALRIEVTSAKRYPDGVLRFPKHRDTSRYDILALVLPDGSVEYRPEITL